MDWRAETTQQPVATQAEGDPAALDRLVPFADAKNRSQGPGSPEIGDVRHAANTSISRVGSIFHKVPIAF